MNSLNLDPSVLPNAKMTPSVHRDCPAIAPILHLYAGWGTMAKPSNPDLSRDGRVQCHWCYRAAAAVLRRPLQALIDSLITNCRSAEKNEDLEAESLRAASCLHRAHAVVLYENRQAKRQYGLNTHSPAVIASKRGSLNRTTLSTSRRPVPCQLLLRLKAHALPCPAAHPTTRLAPFQPVPWLKTPVSWQLVGWVGSAGRHLASTDYCKRAVRREVVGHERTSNVRHIALDGIRDNECTCRLTAARAASKPRAIALGLAGAGLAFSRDIARGSSSCILSRNLSLIIGATSAIPVLTCAWEEAGHENSSWPKHVFPRSARRIYCTIYDMSMSEPLTVVADVASMNTCPPRERVPVILPEHCTIHGKTSLLGLRDSQSVGALGQTSAIMSMETAESNKIRSAQGTRPRCVRPNHKVFLQPYCTVGSLAAPANQSTRTAQLHRDVGIIGTLTNPRLSKQISQFSHHQLATQCYLGARALDKCDFPEINRLWQEVTQKTWPSPTTHLVGYTPRTHLPYRTLLRNSDSESCWVPGPCLCCIAAGRIQIRCIRDCVAFDPAICCAAEHKYKVPSPLPDDKSHLCK
ncbi:uncharacterized protein MYCFIDRAFT_169698 [Pseudocercospora fijiensis CIRAD86]|uniref:Uncharacterized protein n=1 Tax=Pseudocercospora fijiensis (strain CIRAD86) TaxID=383855 RepID=N1Q864_PSEFD|nr:uncharacterized protein MYCFIDRAFT_169698 [Pseudocercospora fijiensis CIRAD86]EME87971.1 hypothetical protein MYCFIDRAFT_169698 [Pseudocercospora fijiensis CIRAD86]